jgi:hypothetical protein
MQREATEEEAVKTDGVMRDFYTDVCATGEAELAAHDAAEEAGMTDRDRWDQNVSRSIEDEEKSAQE